MRLGYLKQSLGALATIALFVLAGLFGTDPILARLSKLKSNQFSVYSSSQTAHVGRASLKASSPGKFRIGYTGIKEIKQRPVDLHFIIRFETLNTLHINLQGSNGQVARIGVLSPAEKWYYARDFYLDAPLLLRVELTESKAFLFAGKYASEGIVLPDWPISAIEIEGIDSAIEIFSVNAYSFIEGIPDRTLLKTSGQYLHLDNKYAVFPPIVLGLLGFSLFLLVTFLSRHFFHQTLAGIWFLLFWIGFGLFWFCSWKPPAALTSIIYLFSLFAFSISVIFLSLKNVLKLKFFQTWLGYSGLLAVVVSTILLLFSSNSILLNGIFILVLFISIPIFGFPIAKAQHSDFHSGIKKDAITFLSLLIFVIGALLAGKRFYGLYIGLGSAFSFSLRMALLFQYRKKISLSQPVLLIAFVFMIFSLEVALASAVKSGPIPKFGTLLATDSRWIPKTILKDEFPKNPKDNSPIFQNKQFAKPKPPDEYRIVFLGGSTTYGHPTEPSLNFVTQIQEKLRQDFPEKRLEVYNCGYPGFTSLQMLLAYNNYLKDAQIDLLMMYTLNNDMYQPGLFTYREIWQQSQNETVGYVHGIRKALLSSALYRLSVGAYHSLIQGHGYAPSKKILRDFRQNLKEILNFAKQQNTTIVLVPEMINPDLATKNQKALSRQLASVLKEFGNTEQIYFLKPGNLGKPTEIFTDNVHLTVEGNERIANKMYSIIKKEIEEQ